MPVLTPSIDSSATSNGGDPFLRWQIGDVRVTRVVEHVSNGIGKRVLPQATPDELRQIPWLYPDYVDQDDRLLLSVHALVVETPDLRLIVDTCVGNDKQRRYRAWNQLQLPFLEHLGLAGYPPESIDRVLCTHLHVDHVGWNTRLVGEGDSRHWAPTFPNARYLFGRDEWQHWQNATEDPLAQDPVLDDSVRPILDAGLADLVATDHQVCPEVQLRPSPGHTPGHVSVWISSRGEQAVITGDSIHHPCQCVHPDWSAAPDFDPEQSRATRRALLEQCASEPILLIGTHFAGATAGRVVRDGDAYRLVTD